MNGIVQFVMKHGYSVLFAAVFARQIGLPLPAPLFLLAAGALAHAGSLGLIPAVGLSITACVLADWVWYEAGRQWGHRVVHFVHRFTPEPAATARRSKKLFARYGPLLLVVAKFVPGLDAVAPPLAGTSRTSRPCFLGFETVGATLWAAAYAGLGYVFAHDLDRATAYVGRVGALLAGLLAFAGLFSYVLHKLFRQHRSRRDPQVVRTAAPDSLRQPI